MMSKHLECELVAIECSTNVVYRFGETDNYKNRAVLMYDGIHYDIFAETKDHEVRLVRRLC